jgi:hypothetical protein
VLVQFIHIPRSVYAVFIQAYHEGYHSLSLSGRPGSGEVLLPEKCHPIGGGAMDAGQETGARHFLEQPSTLPAEDLAAWFVALIPSAGRFEASVWTHLGPGRRDPIEWVRLGGR